MKPRENHFVSFNMVEFSYPSSIFPILKDLNFELRPGWTGITGENGAGKTTLLRLAAGLLEPGGGTIRRPESRLYCPQRTDDIPERWEDFFYADDNAAGKLLDRLGIGQDWPYRWDTLSHGERKRLQLAIALWQDPALLAVDEPTNHLDREARTLIGDALAGYTGLGLLVSHDRALLDRLCTSCLFIRDNRVTLRPGGISQGLEEEKREQTEQQRNRKKIRGERDRLAAEADSRRRTVESAKNRMTKKHIDPKDNDTKRKIDLARLTGKDAVGAKLYKQMENRLEKTDQLLENTHTRKERKTGITLRGNASQADRLFFLEADRLFFLEANRLTLDAEARPVRSLAFPDLLMQGGDRIALTGPNGSGKSTLIRRFLEIIPKTIPVLYLPQEITMAESRTILGELAGEEEAIRGEIISRFSRLGSDPQCLLQSELPSPGEVRKLMIARGIFYEPALIIMDEPTNHLDLTSIELLEEALGECEAALLLVSHDEVFLSRLTEKEWTIRDGVLRIL